jgi:hypothetical protein
MEPSHTKNSFFGLRTKRQPRPWAVVVVLAFLPFLLRMGLDLNSINRLAVANVYRAWRTSMSTPELKSNETLIFERSEDKEVFEDFFLSQLQKDFKVVEFGEHPRVRAYFEKERTLTTRVEWKLPKGEWREWNGEARLVNNGILLGLWAGVLFFFLGKSTLFSIGVSSFLMLYWKSRWDLLSIPSLVFHDFSFAFKDFWTAFKTWIPGGSDLGHLPLLVASVYALVILAGFVPWVQRRFSDKQRMQALVAFSFVLEPVVIWLASVWAPWPADASWWKVYIGSFAYRFVSLAYSFALLMTPKIEESQWVYQSWESPKPRWNPWALILPPIFVFAGGWEWLHAVLVVDSGSSILHLKAFLIAVLLAALTGSRLMSILVGLWVLVTVALPTRGHWDAASTFGFFMDGLLVGWWVSPFKGREPIFPFTQSRRIFLLATGVSWVFGIFLSTAGMPLGLCWLAVFMALWAASQVASSEWLIGLK